MEFEKINCKKCNKEFDRPVKGYRKSFCSRTCANSRTFSKESNRKRSESNKKHYENLSKEEKIKRNKRISENSFKRTETYIKNFMKADFESLKRGTKFRRVLIEQNNKCLSCGIDEWFGKKITLELDHIDGNNKNNERNNLRYLCPNCHSLTDTWRGRNNTGKKNSNYKHGRNSIENL